MSQSSVYTFWASKTIVDGHVGKVCVDRRGGGEQGWTLLTVKRSQ